MSCSAMNHRNKQVIDATCQIHIWLVVEPTQLKNITVVKLGSSSPIFGVENEKIFELPPPRYAPFSWIFQRHKLVNFLRGARGQVSSLPTIQETCSFSIPTSS